MDDIKAKALDAALMVAPRPLQSMLLIEEAKRIEAYLRGDSTGPQVKTVADWAKREASEAGAGLMGLSIASQLPDTFQRIIDTDGKVYDKHAAPPFMREQLGTASNGLTGADLYDDAKMAERKADKNPTGDPADY